MTRKLRPATVFSSLAAFFFRFSILHAGVGVVYKGEVLFDGWSLC